MIPVAQAARNARRAMGAVLGPEAADVAVAELVDAYEERAAIGEFAGGLDRAAAERMAYARVWARAAEEWRRTR